MRDEHDFKQAYYRQQVEIRELEEINKMLQRNMFHYELSTKAEIAKNIQLEEKIESLEGQLKILRTEYNTRAEGEE